MKPYIQLVLFKQWLQYILLVTTIVIALVLIGIGYRVAHDNFKIPITIQDLDQTTASKSFVNKIKQSDYVTIKKSMKMKAILKMMLLKGSYFKYANT